MNLLYALAGKSGVEIRYVPCNGVFINLSNGVPHGNRIAAGGFRGVKRTLPRSMKQSEGAVMCDCDWYSSRASRLAFRITV